VRVSERMGMTYDQPTQDSAEEIIEGNYGAFTLGYNATSPLALANSYATVAARGTQCDPVPLLEVLDRTGQPLTGDDGSPVLSGPSCTPEAIPAPVADTLANILVGDVASSAGTGTRAAIPGHVIGGKTGTSQGRDSVAFVGFMPEYAASVMVFNPKTQQDVGGYGGNMPATIFRDAMTPYLADKPTGTFPPVDPTLMGQGSPADQAPATADDDTDTGGTDTGTTDTADQGNGNGNGGNGGGRGNWNGNGGGRGN
jgi:membrane peptidoglycan carboxypeptidase